MARKTKRAPFDLDEIEQVVGLVKTKQGVRPVWVAIGPVIDGLTLLDVAGRALPGRAK